MKMTPELAQFIAKTDQLTTLLSNAFLRLERKTPGRTFDILDELYKEFLAEENMGDKLVLHAAVVGVLHMVQDILEEASSEENNNAE